MSDKITLRNIRTLVQSTIFNILSDKSSGLSIMEVRKVTDREPVQKRHNTADNLVEVGPPRRIEIGTRTIDWNRRRENLEVQILVTSRKEEMIRKIPDDIVYLLDKNQSITRGIGLTKFHYIIEDNDPERMKGDLTRYSATVIARYRWVGKYDSTNDC